VLFDNEVLDCLVGLFFSVIRLELLALIGGLHEFPTFFVVLELELACLTCLGDRGNVTDIWTRTNK
jgi:hypothetical protein